MDEGDADSMNAGQRTNTEVDEEPAVITKGIQGEGRTVRDFAEGTQEFDIEDGQASIILVWGQEKIAVPKTLACSQSTFFKATCKHKSGEQAEPTEIVLSTKDSGTLNHHPSILQLMVEYLHRSTYDVKTSFTNNHGNRYLRLFAAPGDRTVLLHSLLFALAETYDVAGLRKLARNNLYNFWTRVCCRKEDIILAIDHVYLRLPREASSLRDTIRACILRDLLTTRPPQYLSRLCCATKDRIMEDVACWDADDADDTDGECIGGLPKEIFLETRRQLIDVLDVAASHADAGVETEVSEERTAEETMDEKSH